MSICSVSNCGRPVIARELCSSHYARARRGVSLDKPLGTKTPGGKPCSIDGCNKRAASSGLCTTHRARKLAGADLLAPVATKFVTDDLLERLRFYAPEGGPDECWEWTAARNKNYGAMAVHGSRMRMAHVVAWELHHGQSLPAGMVVRHTCDNPPCVNPAHLVLDTQAANVADKVAKGRQDAGEKHGLAKLANEDIVEICRLYDTGVSQRRIADQFGISQANVSFIVRGKAWSHLDASTIAPDAKARHIKLTEDQVREIRRLYASGTWTHARLAKRFGVSDASICGLINRTIWANVQ
jgi:predicted transcriptional regulator